MFRDEILGRYDEVDQRAVVPRRKYGAAGHDVPHSRIYVSHRSIDREQTDDIRTHVSTTRRASLGACNLMTDPFFHAGDMEDVAAMKSQCSRVSEDLFDATGALEEGVRWTRF